MAMEDPEVNLAGGEGKAYTPSAYEDEYEPSESLGNEANLEAEGSTVAVEPPASREQTTKNEKEVS